MAWTRRRADRDGASSPGLIVPLGRLGRVRVLVGSRRSLDGAVVPEGEERHGRLRAAFGADAIIDDLEDEQETREDIAEYVRLRLAAAPKHRDNRPAIAAAAERVASRADGVFLYARIVSRTLQELDRLDGELPATALEAFAHDLRARFGAEEQRVDDLLAALAWGEGKGLTRRVWPLVANALARRRRSTMTTTWPGSWGTPAGTSSRPERMARRSTVWVIRRWPTIIADGWNEEAQDRIVTALTEWDRGAGWLDCDRYIWRHLADHAAQADRLDALIRDPGYLAVADPVRLVSLLPGIRDEQGQRFADIYNRVVDRLIDEPPLERLPLIHMTAQMEAPDLAPQLEPPVATRWRCRWARVRPSTPHRVIGRHTGPVTAVALGEVDGRAVVVSGSDDQTIRLWDARTRGADRRAARRAHAAGSRLSRWARSTAARSWFREVTIRPSGCGMRARGGDRRATRGHTSGSGLSRWVRWTAAPVVVSGSRMRPSGCGMRARGGDRRAARRAHGAGHCCRAGRGRRPRGGGLGKCRSDHPAVGCAQRGGDRRAARRAHGRVTAVALGAVDGRAVVVSGGLDATIRLWDARTGRRSASRSQGTRTRSMPSRWARSTAARWWCREVTIATIRLWDARSGAADRRAARRAHERGHCCRAGRGRRPRGGGVGKRRSDHPAVGCAQRGGDRRAARRAHGLGHRCRAGRGRRPRGGGVGKLRWTIRLWDARTGAAIGAPLVGHTDGSRCRAGRGRRPRGGGLGKSR